MERVGDEDDVADVADLEEGGGGGQGLPRRLAQDLPQDVVVGHALGVEVVGRSGGLGEAVAGLAAAGDDDHGRHAPVVEVDSMVEPGPQDGGRPTVVLGGAEDHDGLGLVGTVVA